MRSKFREKGLKKRFDVSLADIQDAKLELEKYLKPSPLVYNSWLSDALGCEIYLKLENMQPIGSFKIRGATYKISKLSAKEKKLGVIAASAGNHAQGVAWGSRKLGVSSLIVMPITAPIVKVQNTKALGAEVIQKGTNYDEAYEAAVDIAQKTKRVFVHAFEDEAVIAGQGTTALEILEQLPEVDCVISSVGGGGLMSGVATAFKALRPQSFLIAGQSAGSPSMIQSIKKGRAITLDHVSTFADGIAVSHASENIRRILSETVNQWVEVEDDEIAASILTLLEKAKIITEGAGALPLAVLEKVRSKVRGKKVVLIISGGNIDVNLLNRIIDVGLIRAGRRVRVNVLISDRPGSLAGLTDLLAKQGANIIQAIHDRNEPSTKIDQTEVALTLETRGSDHSAAVIDALRSHGIRVELTH